MGSSSRIFGNRPDCAYYLLLGFCAAAVFTVFGGIFTYMGYWPQMVFQQSAANGLHHQQIWNNNNNNNYVEYSHKTLTNDTSIEVYAIIGPLLLAIGVAIALLVAILAIKYDCEHEPEEPKIAILRLASEMSLSQESKYELMSRRPLGLSTFSPQNNEVPVASSSSTAGPSQVPTELTQYNHRHYFEDEVQSGTSGGASSSRHLAV